MADTGKPDRPTPGPAGPASDRPDPAGSDRLALGGLVPRREREPEQARCLAVELQERHRHAVRDPSELVELVEVVRGGEAVVRRGSRWCGTPGTRCGFVDEPPYAQPPTVPHPVERELLGRCVRFRGVHDRAALDLNRSTPVLSTSDTRLSALLTTGMPDRGTAEQPGPSYRTSSAGSRR